MELSAIEKSSMSKIKWHILPLGLFLYITNIIDRGNIGFTALDMNTALGIEAAAFGTVTSIFFVGYFIFGIPSNIIMNRLGAKKWMSFILVAWGLVTCSMFFAENFTHVVILRVLLGVTEAGFFPGMIFYFSLWFPQRYLGGITSIFFLAAPIAGIIGPPLATGIMDNVHWLGHDGWRWVFMIEGLLAVVGGILTVFYFKNKPQDAKWLSSEEKDWIVNKLAEESAAKKETAHFTIGKVFTYGKVWRLALIYMFIQIAQQSASFWLPTIVKEFSSSFSNTTVGLLMMLPSILATLVMLFWGSHSDKTGERVLHTAIPMFMLALSLFLMAVGTSMTVKIIGLVLTGIGMYAFYGPFWSIPGLYLTGEAAAIGVALINTMSSFGGFSGNLVVGYLKGSTFGTPGVFTFQILCAVIAFLLTITLKVKKTNISKGKQDMTA